MEKDVTTTNEKVNFNVAPGFTSKDSYTLLWNMASMFSKSEIVPKQFQGEKHIGDCAIAINMAQRMGADPMMLMQNMYVVYNNPSFSSKFLIATFNQCGRYSSIKYKATGEKGKDTWGCIAYTAELNTGEIIEGPEVTIGMAKKEGWYSNTKWQNMPEQMLRYRSAAFLIRTTAPEISMGLQTVEEIHDIAEKDITPVAKPTTEISRNMASETIDAPKTLPKAKENIKADIPAKTLEKEKVEKKAPGPVENAASAELPEEPDF